MWQVGGAQGAPTPAKPSAVSVTDIRDVEHPFTYPTSFEADVRRTASTCGSTHSVDVDFDGVAWVSGTGGARGWWTEGLHKDPVTGQMRYATPYDPTAVRRRLGRRQRPARSCTTPTTCRRRSATRRRAT